MPSSIKILHYLSSALLIAISAGVLGFGMSTTWGETTINCAATLTGNGSAVIIWRIFNSTLISNNCPTFQDEEPFGVLTTLDKTGLTPLVLHALVLSLLVLCIVFSAVGLLIAIYNSVSNPYETYMGPIGIYTCNSLSACFSVLAIIIYVSNVNLTNMAEEVVKYLRNSPQLELTDKYSEMGVGYYLVIPYAVLSLISIAMIYTYDHAAYRHKKEQQRPTEDVPKEIMMY